MLTKIISGGQTGADQGALAAAKVLGLQTGGWAPRDFRTEDGFNSRLELDYGLQEHSSGRYAPRTQSNVLMSDATLIFGNLSSPGTTLTRRYADRYHKPHFSYTWLDPQQALESSPNVDFIPWLNYYDIKVLNVAGNRESQNPGIYYAIKFFLLVNLEPMLKQKISAATSMSNA